MKKILLHSCCAPCGAHVIKELQKKYEVDKIKEDERFLFTRFDKFTDFLRIGFFTKIKTILDNSVYGIVGIFSNIGIISSEYYKYLRFMLSIIYMVGIIDLFTGKKVAY